MNIDYKYIYEKKRLKPNSVKGHKTEQIAEMEKEKNKYGMSKL